MQIAFGIMFGFIFLALAITLIAGGAFLIYILVNKRETVLNMKEKYDFDDEYDDYDEELNIQDWFEKGDN